jgi:hypothetical protein
VTTSKVQKAITNPVDVFSVGKGMVTQAVFVFVRGCDEEPATEISDGLALNESASTEALGQLEYGETFH